MFFPCCVVQQAFVALFTELAVLFLKLSAIPQVQVKEE
jgi:hypothetical protein